MTKAADIADYIELLHRFDIGEISISDFESAYFQLFKAEKRMFEEPLYEILNNIFTALDVHVEDGIKQFTCDLTTEELICELRMSYSDLVRYFEAD